MCSFLKLIPRIPYSKNWTSWSTIFQICFPEPNIQNLYFPNVNPSSREFNSLEYNFPNLFSRIKHSEFIFSQMFIPYPKNSICWNKIFMNLFSKHEILKPHIPKWYFHRPQNPIFWKSNFLPNILNLYFPKYHIGKIWFLEIQFCKFVFPNPKPRDYIFPDVSFLNPMHSKNSISRSTFPKSVSLNPMSPKTYFPKCQFPKSHI